MMILFFEKIKLATGQRRHGEIVGQEKQLRQCNWWRWDGHQQRTS